MIPSSYTCIVSEAKMWLMILQPGHTEVFEITVYVYHLYTVYIADYIAISFLDFLDLLLLSSDLSITSKYSFVLLRIMQYFLAKFLTLASVQSLYLYHYNNRYLGTHVLTNSESSTHKCSWDNQVAGADDILTQLSSSSTVCK